MQANKRTLGEILAADIRLIAPLFQRPYVWNEEENWEPLWRAIVETAEKRLQGEKPRPYFMGAIVLDNMNVPVGTITTREIIDGQQRMTTLQILMEAAKGLTQAGSELHLLLDRITRNILGSGSDQRFKVWPTNIDRDAFRKVMLGESSGGRMHEARKFFHEHLEEWIGTGEERELRLHAIVHTLNSDLIFVAIDLDNDDDGQLIFETLNSLGAPLLPSDLVKNLLFRAALAEHLETDDLYNRYWRQFEEEGGYWRAKVEVGRRERTRLDLYLQHYLIFHIGRESQAAHQFRDYRDSFLDGKFGDVKGALEDFSRVAEIYKRFDTASGDDVVGRLRHLLRAMGVVLPVPLILGALANASTAEEQEAMLEIIESYLVRRLLGGSGSKNLSRVVSDLVSHLNAAGWSADSLHNALLEMKGHSSVWFDDAHLLWRLTSRAAYYDIRTTGLVYVLARSENALRSKFSEQPFSLDTKLEVEHIMPQKWKEHWPLQEDALPDAEPSRNEQINRIGNLTLLTAPLNLSVSNAGWAEKREKLRRHSVLMLNRTLAENENWNEASIGERSRELATLFCAIWPR